MRNALLFFVIWVSLCWCLNAQDNSTVDNMNITANDTQIDEIQNVNVDCNGDINGTAYVDECGMCSDGLTEIIPNVDMDCFGTCFGTLKLDCSDTCNGTATFDDCGVCSGGSTGSIPNEHMDCSGACYGNSILDCSDECDGTALLDDCSVCSGGNTMLNANVDKDCNGDCFGFAYTDDCGVCSGGKTGKSLNSNKDCNGDCFGTASLDDCYVCSGGNTIQVPNAHKDCFGVCYGTAQIDACGVCGGDSTNCCVCPKDTGYYKTSNCFSSPRLTHKHWPGEYFDCNESICGFEWIKILWRPGFFNRWRTLARQYIAAKLNLENTICFSDKKAKDFITSAVEEAEGVLKRNCASITRHNADNKVAFNLAWTLYGFNNRVNGTLFSRENKCNSHVDKNVGKQNVENRLQRYERKRNDHAELPPYCGVLSMEQITLDSDEQIKYVMENDLDILGGKPLVQCKGGATLPVEYWTYHNSRRHHPQQNKQWGDANNLSLLHNCALCGDNLSSLISKKVSPQNMNDSYVLLSKQWVTAINNVLYNEACLTKTISNSLVDTYYMIHDNCIGEHFDGGHEYTSVSSNLGQMYMTQAEILTAYNEGEWGPHNTASELIKSAKK